MTPEHIGIVGSEAAKFTPAMERAARELIRHLLVELPHDTPILVSGGCHLGGIDIWAEEEADKLGLSSRIHLPKQRRWSGGYKERNILIAEDSHILHNITVEQYHPDYKGMRFKHCYHCGTGSHVKSGGCWTMKRARQLGKPAFLHVIRLDGTLA